MSLNNFLLNYLKDRGIDITINDHKAYKLKAAGFMDLVVEVWQSGQTTFVSLAHYGEQNGDLMKDPDMLFKVKDGIVTPIEFQNDYVGVYQDAIDNPRLQKELLSFAKTWINNLIEQGHQLQKEVDENE